MGYASNWGKIWPQFATDREVLVLDQRGHGRSEKPATGYAPEDYARDVLGLLDKLHWEKAHLLGHSMGGRVAMQFAHDHPERTATLLLEDSGAEARPDRLQWVRGLLARVPTPFADREDARRFFAEEFARDPLLGGFLHANIEKREDGAFDWRFLPAAMIETIAEGRAKDALPMFRAIRAPTLIVRGERSEEFPRAEAERMRDSRPGVELVEIAGAGHFVHPTHPEEFASAVRDFLSRHE